MSTTLTLDGEAKIAGIPTDGLICVAFKESQFTSAPQLNTPLPSLTTFDGGPVISSSQYGSTGRYQIIVPDSGNYWVACVVNITDAVVAWEYKAATTHSSFQTAGALKVYTQTQRVTAHNTANGSQTLSDGGNLLLNSSLPFPGTGGIINVSTTSGNRIMSYGGRDGGNNLTGLSNTQGASILSGSSVDLVYQNGSRRRLVNWQIRLIVAQGAGNYAEVQGQVTSTLGIGGRYTGIPVSHYKFKGDAAAVDVGVTLSFFVEPNEYYWAQGFINPSSLSSITDANGASEFDI